MQLRNPLLLYPSLSDKDGTRIIIINKRQFDNGPLALTAISFSTVQTQQQQQQQPSEQPSKQARASKVGRGDEGRAHAHPLAILRQIKFNLN